MSVGRVGVVLRETLYLRYGLPSLTHHHGADSSCTWYGTSLNQTHMAIATITGRRLTFQGTIRNFYFFCSLKDPLERGMEADVNEEGVQEALSFAVSEFNKRSNDAYQSRAMRVVRARKQVVSGMNYFLDVKLGRTTCTKSQTNLDSCPFHDQPHLKREKLCSFQATDRLSLTPLQSAHTCGG
uniref:Cystatin domain-containing protein n=1 Tax=Capra hircus TaxID=9925 RepID=A0A8C2R7F4_CAPHI